MREDEALVAALAPEEPAQVGEDGGRLALARPRVRLRGGAGDTRDMRGRCAGGAREMRGRCAGDAREIHASEAECREVGPRGACMKPGWWCGTASSVRRIFVRLDHSRFGSGRSRRRRERLLVGSCVPTSFFSRRIIACEITLHSSNRMMKVL